MDDKEDGSLEKGYLDQGDNDAPSPASRAKDYALWAVSKGRPSFMSTAWSRKSKLRRTAYLDGLRGFAALLVYFMHHELWAHPNPFNMERAWGYEDRYYFVTFPFVRTFFVGGHVAVSTFFVISGYVLSTKPIALLQSGDYVGFGDNVASALFRRWFRLWLPIIATTLFNISLWHVFGIFCKFAPQRTIGSELWRWYTEIKNFSFFWDTSTFFFTYNDHCWSIPVEMRGSITIYASLMAFSRCSRNARLLGYCALIYYFLYIVDGAFCALFVGGMLLSDLDQLSLNKNLPAWLHKLNPSHPWPYYVLFTASLFLGGVPSNDDIQLLRDSPGWYYLSLLKPQAVFEYKWFYLFFAATGLVASIPRIAPLKRFFESGFCQYLGRISFAFYLVHGPVLWTLGDRVYAAVGWSREDHALVVPGWSHRFPLPKWGPFGLELSWVLAQLILLPATFWMAELVTALIDEPSIRFAQWLYGKTRDDEVENRRVKIAA
ncbi:hypothetical protein MBLNU230_g8666t1 [Neophaeotheca triangularis]